MSSRYEKMSDSTRATSEDHNGGSRLSSDPIFQADEHAQPSLPAAVLSTTSPVALGWWYRITTLGQTVNVDGAGAGNWTVDVEKDTSDPVPAPSSLPYNIATSEDLDHIEALHPLPERAENKSNRSWSHKLRFQVLASYNKLFLLAVVANAIGAAFVFQEMSSAYQNASTATAANFLAALVCRNEHFINIMFRAVSGLPHCFPLWIRKRAAKVYSYGGLHSGCGASGAVWYLVFFALFVKRTPFGASGVQVCRAVSAVALLLLLPLIVLTANPWLRSRHHNTWEMIHRFAGWSVVALFWLQTMLLSVTESKSEARPLRTVLVKTPTFWLLILITMLLIYPWTRLHRRQVRAERLSDHAVRLHFDYTKLVAGVGIRLTDAPLKETHGFATIPNPDGQPGFSCIVSRAGDWTRKIINNPPTHLWTKGAPTMGVARVSIAFRKVLLVTTGSGIGPCLSIMQGEPDLPVRVLWSTKDPWKTYGSDVIERVFRTDYRAVVVNTNKTGRPNLLHLAYSMYKSSGAEAVVVISNPSSTKLVVGGLEACGVPAFGVIFDS